MNIAIISPYRTVAPHFETDLEIAQQHLDAGDCVVSLACDGREQSLANCDFNPQKDPDTCEQCRRRRTMGWDLIDGKVDHLSPASLVSLSVPPQPGSSKNSAAESGCLENGSTVRKDFESLADLMAYRIENFEIGYAALSSLVSIVRDPEPDLTQHRQTLNAFLESAWQSWRQTLAYLDQHEVDRVYTYNGRFAAMRGVLRACQSRGVDCFLHERGCDKDHFELFENHLPHDIDVIHQTIETLWDDADEQQRIEDGRQWYLDRVNRVESGWKSFVKSQDRGSLPEGFDSTRKNVAIFCSSDDEFVAIGDCWRNSLYPNQVTAIRDIAKSMLDADPETHLYLRVHPNLAAVDNQRKREMMALTSPNLTVIAADDPVDTYELMQRCDITASFGSSVGIEAVYWGRPSVLLGPCLYQHLDGPVRSQSHAQTISLLRQSLPLEVSDSTGALKYGHWFQTRGQRYRHYSADTLYDGTFSGKAVFACPPRRSLKQKLRDRVRRLVGSVG